MSGVSDEESTKAASTTKNKPVQGDPESEEGEEGTEYEIEQVLDARRGYFPDVWMILSESPISYSNDAFSRFRDAWATM